MRLLEERILADGEICGEEVLKVGSFLNQQIDVPFIYEVTAEFKRVFGAENVTKILTIEASGIGIACLAAQHFNCPVLFAKKGKSSNRLHTERFTILRFQRRLFRKMTECL